MATGTKAAKKGAAKKAPAKKSAKAPAKKSAARASSKPAAKKAAPAKKPAAKKSSAGSKRSPNPAFMKPMKPSSELSAVVGSSPQPRTEVTKKIWDYIKKNNLQDSQNKRMINADDKLKPVFKKQQVSMFEMTALVNKHLS
ncbi:MAG TPA: SWIB/MDM2 domain-containing protein [Burkholderiaceae bacterium]|nr:SWIB/MDM2 domain-containing protein [Burkholderiaceae bacterium]